MDFGAILKRSWEITWKNKGLWLLGILAGCSASGGGGGGNYTSGFRGYNLGRQELPPDIERYIERLPEEVVLIAVVVLCLLLLLGLVFIVLGSLGQAGLIAGFDRADETGAVSLAEAFNLGLSYFWKILVIRLIVGFLILVVLAIIGVGALFATIATRRIGELCLIPLVCLLLPVGMAVNVYTTLVQVALVVDKVGIGQAFGRAWQTIREKPGPVIIMALILIFGGMLVGVIVGLPLILALVPGILVLIASGERALSTAAIASLVCGAALVPVVIFLNGVLQTYITGAWTLTYRRLIGQLGAGAEISAPVPAPG